MLSSMYSAIMADVKSAALPGIRKGSANAAKERMRVSDNAVREEMRPEAMGRRHFTGWMASASLSIRSLRE